MPPSSGRTSSDLCKAMSCPLVAGARVLLQVSQKLPTLAPPGAYGMRLEGADGAGVRFMCVDVQFNVAWPALRSAEEGAATSR